MLSRSVKFVLELACVALVGCAESWDVPSPEEVASVETPPAVRLNGGQGILNGGFEQWKNQFPPPWVSASWGAPAISIAEIADGTRALESGPNYPVDTVQTVAVEGPLAGRTLVLTGYVKASEPEVARIGIELAPGKRCYSECHSGDGNWHQLRVSCPVPAGFQAKQFVVVLNHQKKPTKSCYFDEVKIAVE